MMQATAALSAKEVTMMPKDSPTPTDDDQIDPTTGEVLPAGEVDLGDDAPDFDPQIETLMGDMRDAILMRIRTLQKPWAQMAEREQTDCANGVELAARDIIRKTVRLLNQHEWPHTVVELSEMKIGGTKGIEAKIACANISHNRETLGDHIGSQVMLLMVDSETFMAERAPVKVDKDQPDLPIDADSDADEADGEA